MPQRGRVGWAAGGAWTIARQGVRKMVARERVASHQARLKNRASDRQMWAWEAAGRKPRGPDMVIGSAGASQTKAKPAPVADSAFSGRWKTGRSPAAGQKGFTITKMTMPIISSVGTSLAMR